MVLGLTYSFSIISAFILVVTSFLIGNEIDRKVFGNKKNDKIQVNDSLNSIEGFDRDNKLEISNKTIS